MACDIIFLTKDQLSDIVIAGIRVYLPSTFRLKPCPVCVSFDLAVSYI